MEIFFFHLYMVVRFDNSDLESLYINGKGRGKQQFPDNVIRKFIGRINIMKSAKNTNDLRAIGVLHFEKLKGHLNGKYSIRVQDGYRLIFLVEHDIFKIEEIVIEDMNNHDYADKS